MAELLVASGGVLLVLLVFGDALSTTLVVAEGAGPLTRRIVGALWRAALRLHRPDSRSPLLTIAGPMLLMTTVLVWVVGLWAGWTLIFLSGTDAVVDSRTQAPAGVTDTAYFSGFTVFTLGTGDYVGATPLWRLTSAFASFTGLFLVTLAIAYLISVISAVVARRTLAIIINAMGPTAHDIVLRGWTGAGFSSGFAQHLITLTDKLAISAEQHLAYPVLHYFHAHHRANSAPVALAHLEDALLLLTAALDPSARPHAATTGPLRYVVERYATAAAATSALPHPGSAPPTPPLKQLAEAGLPLVHQESFATAVDAEAEGRTELRRLVNGDGWSWPRNVS